MSGKRNNNNTRRMDVAFGGFDDDMDDIKEISIEELENDSELLGELKELGWSDDHVEFTSEKKAKSSQYQQPMESKKTAKKVVDITQEIASIHVDEVDESAIELSEEDYNDPEFLSQLKAFEMDGNDDNDVDNEEDQVESNQYGSKPIALSSSSSSSLAASSTNSATVVAKPPTTPGAVATSMNTAPLATATDIKQVGGPTKEQQIATAKANALRLKKEGKTDEALMWLRTAKMIEAGGTVETMVISQNPAAAISRAPAVAPTKPTKAPATAPPSSSAVSASSVAVSRSGASSSGSSKVVALNSSVESIASDVSRSGSGIVGGARVGNTSTSPRDGFSLLEDALRSAADAALQEAKHLKEIDKKAAIDRMREYKNYQQELDVLNSRRTIPGAQPALFRWQTTRKETKIENLDIGIDQIRLTLGTLTGVESSVLGSASKVTLNYDLGIPKDDHLTGTISGTVKAGVIEFNHNELLPLVIKRTSDKKVLTLAYQRKAATFAITCKQGFLFKSEVMIGIVTVPLGDLLTKLECGGTVGLTRENDKGKLKEVPGALVVKLTLRTPIAAPLVSVSEQRVLVVETWPEVRPIVTPQPILQSPAAVASEPMCAASTVTAPAPTPTPAASPQVSAAATAAPAAPSDSFADVTPQERNDPLGVEWLVSNDVLDDDLARSQEQLAACKDPDAKFYLQLRVQLISTKLAMLVKSVQEETISIDQYLDILRERVARDKRLALLLRQEFAKLNASPNKDPEELQEKAKAVRGVEHRIKIMTDEIQGAEAAANAPDDD